MKAQIPSSIEEATSALGGLGRLLIAKQWERAAIVYAFTTDQQGSNQHQKKSSDALGINEFAALGITGLSSAPQVRAYRVAWEKAMLDGAPSVKPGDLFEVPILPWKDHFGESTGEVQARVAVSFFREHPEQITKVTHERSDIASKLIEAALDDPLLGHVIELKQSIRAHDSEPEREHRPAPPRKPHDYRNDLVHGTGLVYRVLKAVERGDYALSGVEQLLLHAVGMLINQAGTDAGAPADLWVEIEQHLNRASSEVTE